MIRRQRGFTLVELLISLALATVGLLGMLALVGVAIRGNAVSRELTEATGIAQATLETAELTPFASLPTLAGTRDDVSPTGDGSRSFYQVVTQVAAGASTTTVTVTVSFTDAVGQSHAVTLSTVRSP